MVTIKELLVEEEATIDAIHQLKEQISVVEMEKEELEFNLWTQTNFSKEGVCVKTHVYIFARSAPT